MVAILPYTGPKNQSQLPAFCQAITRPDLFGSGGSLACVTGSAMPRPKRTIKPVFETNFALSVTTLFHPLNSMGDQTVMAQSTIKRALL